MNIPKHIAFILDGNRRWAKERGLTKTEGHTHGFEGAKAIVEACSERGIECITFYAWSTENHKNRDEIERTHIFDIFQKIKEYFDTLKKHDIQFRVIGNYKVLPMPVVAALDWTIKQTKEHKGMILQFAINYGGRDEITRAVKKIMKEGYSADQVTEDVISEHLDTAGLPDPELMVRTGKGNMRLSNYLLWQLAYTEFYFPGVYWPDFTPEELDKALEYYTGIERRKGK